MRSSYPLSLKFMLMVLGAAFLVLSGFRLGTLPFIPGAPYSDAALSHWPAALFLRQSVLDDGAFPVWRDGVMAAQPFAANPLNKTAYPAQWLALLLPASHHLDVLLGLHLLVAGWGLWRWTRRLGQSEAAAAVAALGYALGPRLLAHTGAGHVDLVYALAWWPWLMAELSPHPASHSQATPRSQAAVSIPPDLVGSLRITVFAALLALADVRLSLFAFTLAAAYAVVSARRGAGLRALLRWWPVVPLLLVLTASLVLPLLAWRPYLSRAALTPADAGVFSLSPSGLLGLLGLPTDSGNPELVTYAGLSLLILAVVALVRAPRQHVFWMGAALLAALYALGVNGLLWSALVRAVPALLWFRVPARAWLVLALVVPLLAGYGVDVLLMWLRGGLTARARKRGQLVSMTVAVAAGAGGAFMLLTLPALRGAGAALLLGAATALVVWLALGRRLSVRSAGLLLLALVFADVATTGLRWLEWRGPEDWLIPGNAVADRLEEDGARRVYAPYIQQDGEIVTALPQPVAAGYRLSLFGGVDPFQLAGLVDALAQASGATAAGYDVVQPPIADVAEWAAPDADVLAAWGVTHVASPVALDGWPLLDRASGMVLYRNPSEPQPLNAWGLPDGWPGLPDANTITRLNGMTVGAWALSMAAFVGCLAWLALLQRRRARG